MSAPESALVAEMRRLRALGGNCDDANELIDRAIAVQLEAEARQSPHAASPGAAGWDLSGGECLFGAPHTWQEVSRYLAWYSTGTDAMAPQGCPLTVVDECWICGEVRSRVAPQSPEGN